jgi:hypothetical protein
MVSRATYRSIYISQDVAKDAEFGRVFTCYVLSPQNIHLEFIPLFNLSFTHWELDSLFGQRDEAYQTYEAIATKLLPHQTKIVIQFACSISQYGIAFLVTVERHILNDTTEVRAVSKPSKLNTNSWLAGCQVTAKDLYGDEMAMHLPDVDLPGHGNTMCWWTEPGHSILIVTVWLSKELFRNNSPYLHVQTSKITPSSPCFFQFEERVDVMAFDLFELTPEAVQEAFGSSDPFGR